MTRRTLSPEHRRTVAELVLASSGAPWPVELSVLTTEQLHPWRHPTPFDFHYSEMWRQQLAAGELASAPLTDPDLAAHITTLWARGRVVRGTQIQEVFPEVPEADYRQAILADLEWSRQHVTGIYGVLNACRVLAWLGGQGVLSKAEAADWALEHLPAAYRATITKAASAYCHGRNEPCSPLEVRAFVRWAAEQAAQGPQLR